MGKFQGGMDAVRDWAHILSLGEQQRVAAVRCLIRAPMLSVLDEATSALSGVEEALFYSCFQRLGLSFISVGHRESIIDYHTSVLELCAEGAWRYQSSTDYMASLRQ